jgi:hypothetical protein
MTVSSVSKERAHESQTAGRGMRERLLEAPHLRAWAGGRGNLHKPAFADTERTRGSGDAELT